VTWQWTPTKQRAFECLKGHLVEAPILPYPDPNLEYILDTDASDQNVGAVLSQVQEGQEVVVAYYSESLSPTERNYCTSCKELLTVIKSVKHFRPYLYSRKFRLEILAEFSYQIEHRPGKKHSNADGLSQRPDEGCRQCLNIEKRNLSPPRHKLRMLAYPGKEYDWDQGQLQQKTSTPPEVINHPRANPVLADNIRELRRFQESTPGVVADVYRAKKGGQ